MNRAEISKETFNKIITNRYEQISDVRGNDNYIENEYYSLALGLKLLEIKNKSLLSTRYYITE